MIHFFINLTRNHITYHHDHIKWNVSSIIIFTFSPYMDGHPCSTCKYVNIVQSVTSNPNNLIFDILMTNNLHVSLTLMPLISCSICVKFIVDIYRIPNWMSIGLLKISRENLQVFPGYFQEPNWYNLLSLTFNKLWPWSSYISECDQINPRYKMHTNFFAFLKPNFHKYPYKVHIVL